MKAIICLAGLFERRSLRPITNTLLPKSLCKVMMKLWKRETSKIFKEKGIEGHNHITDI